MTGQPGGAALIQQTGDRVEALLTASATGGTMARERAEELVRLMVDLYGAGLQRLLELFDEHDRIDDVLLDALAADELVAGLLLVHGLHPVDTDTRIAQALDSVRPYLKSHGGDVEVVELTDQAVLRLRLTGSCDGCPSSALTLELAVETAVRDAAPEVTEIEVMPAEKAPELISLASLRVRTAGADPSGGDRADPGRDRGPGPIRSAGWLPVPDVEQLVPGRAEPRSVGGVPVLLCAVGSELFAFLDRCGSCAGSLVGAQLHRRAGGAVNAAVLRCPLCGAHFDVQQAGAGLDDAGKDDTGPDGTGQHLQPLPLLMRADGVDIAVPVSA